MANIKLTLSSTSERSKSIEDELKWMEEEGALYYPIGKNCPKNAQAGCLVYFVRQGFMCARAQVEDIKFFEDGVDSFSFSGEKLFLRGWQLKCLKMELANKKIEHKGFQGFRYVTPEEEEQFENSFDKPTSEKLEPDKERKVTPQGAGFGNNEQNKVVEVAAISFVSNWYSSQDWSVKSVEQEKCGYDLVCCKGEQEENVEVKGIQGNQLSFIITSGEVTQAQLNPNFILCVVSAVLSSAPRLTRMAGGDFLGDFDLTPISYYANQKNK